MATVEQLRDAMLVELAARRRHIDKLQDYYDGEHPFPQPPDKCTSEYQRLAADSTLNLCDLVVDSTAERLEPAGVRFSTAPDGDVDVWEAVWQDNDLDAGSAMVHERALTVGRAFVLVWPLADGGVSITPEDPGECIVRYQPGTRTVVAGLKLVGSDEAADRTVTLFTPSTVYRWRSVPAAGGAASSAGAARTWELYDPDGLGDLTPTNPLGSVPLIEFPCRPDMTGCRVRPELTAGVLRVQNQINKTNFDLAVLGEFMAHPQRYAIGIEQTKDEQGNDVNPLKAGPQRVWVLDSDDPANAKIGQLPAADPSGHLKEIEAKVQYLAAITRTPVYYLQAGMVNVSADAIRAAEAGLVKKVQRHQLVFGERWEQVLRLALSALNDPRSDDSAVELVWKSAESRSMAETVDAATKKASIGVPFRQLAEDIGYSPQQVRRMNADRAAQQLLGIAAQAAVNSGSSAPVTG